MKRAILLAITILLGVATVSADDGAGFRYMPIEDYSRSASITVAGVQDYLARAREQKVDTLYVQVLKDASGRQKTTHIVFVSAGVFYVVDARNYMTIPDLLRGDKLGFVDGLEYYDATARGFADKAEYERIAGAGYLVKADYERAEKGGFVARAEPLTVIPYPVQIPESQFDSVFLKVHFWRWVDAGVGIRTGSPLFSRFAARGWLEAPGPGATSGRDEVRPIRRDLSAYEATEAIDALVSAWKAVPADSALADVPYRKEDAAYVFSGNSRLSLEQDSGRGGLAQAMQRIAEAIRGTPAKPPRDAVVYYLARLNGCYTLAELRELASAVGKGFQSTEDFRKGTAAGFPRGSAYYEAVATGFALYQDYELARTMGLRRYEDYQPIKPVMDSLQALKARHRTRDLRTAAIVLVLQKLESGRTVSVQRITEDVNKLTKEHQVLQRIENGFSAAMTTEAVRAFLDANAAAIEDLGTYSKEDLVFRGR